MLQLDLVLIVGCSPIPTLIPLAVVPSDIIYPIIPYDYLVKLMVEDLLLDVDYLIFEIEEFLYSGTEISKEGITVVLGEE